MKELKVMPGNLIRSCLDGDVTTVDWLVIKHIADGNIQNVYDLRSVYEPIPLTEEWLVRAGFEKTLSIIGKSETEYIDYRMKYFVCFLLPDDRGLEIEFWAKHNTIDDRGYITTVQYIHQLQNLYYALTGTELTIKST